MDKKKDDVMAEMMSNLNHKSKSNSKEKKTSVKSQTPKKSIQSTHSNKSHNIPDTSKPKVSKNNKKSNNNNDQPDASMLAYNTQLKLDVIAAIVGLQRVYGFHNRSQAVRLMMHKCLKKLIGSPDVYRKFKIIESAYLMKTMPAAKRRWDKYHDEYSNK